MVNYISCSIHSFFGILLKRLIYTKIKERLVDEISVLEIILIIAVVVGILIGVFIGFRLGFDYRKKVAETKIKSAEDEAQRIVDAADKDAEARKKYSKASPLTSLSTSVSVSGSSLSIISFKMSSSLIVRAVKISVLYILFIFL